MNIRKICAIAITYVFLCSFNSDSAVSRYDRAQAESRTGGSITTRATGNRDTSSEFTRFRTEGNEALYNLDYPRAREMFLSMTKIAPDAPAGYVYLANNLWLETLNKSRRLSTSLYSSTSFYNQTGESDVTDPKRDREFDELIKHALAVCADRLKKNPNDAEALYYQGSALGLSAGYKATVGRSFRRAISDANRSIQIQRQVLKVDPAYYDAYLSVGLYEYVIDSLPWGWRILARLAGLKGSKTRGIEELETVVNQGKYASDDARVVLIGIYGREKQPDRALSLLETLATKYPQNYLIGIERARMLYLTGHGDKGRDSFEAMLKDSRISSEATDLINYQWGETLMSTGDFASALVKYKQVTEWPHSETGLVSLSHLHSGQALDLLGKRGDALSEYKIVLSRDNIFDSHDQAEHYMKTTYDGKDPQ
jgi:tetratricopeptide (TPR) repeat protein